MRIEALVMWVLGFAVLLTALWVAWTMTPLSAILPFGVVLAVAPVIIAIAIFSLARALEEEPVEVRRRRRAVEED